MRIPIRFLRNAVIGLLAVLQFVIRRVARAKPVEWVAYELSGSVARGAPDEDSSFVWRLHRRPRIATCRQLDRELRVIRETQVRGIVIRLNELHCSLTVLRELRGLLASFRASGKEVVFHADALDNREYWLASVASRLVLSPRGRLDLVGFESSSMAAARPLRRLGVVFDVIRAGIFKSAGETLGADRVSDEQRQQMDEIIGDVSELFLSDVSGGRGTTKEAVQAAVDAGPYVARGAKAAGLVDDLLYADEVRAWLGKDASDGPRRARVGPFSAVLATHAPTADWLLLKDWRHRIAVMDIQGMIVPGKSRSVPGMASTAGSDSLVRTLNQLRNDDGIKAVVLHIDSGGGSALASDLIWRAAKRLAERKPVVAFLDSVAASGGYYIAAAAKQIWAAPTCFTGSIGVFLLRPDTSGVLEKIEVDRVTVRRGAHASLHSAEHRLSDDERAVLQRDVLETYTDFVQTVAAGRSMTEEHVRGLAEGRVYLSTRAHQLGLVDRLGTLHDAVLAARDLTGLTGDVRVEHFRSQVSEWQHLLRLLRRGELDELVRAFIPRFDRVQALWLGERL